MLTQPAHDKHRVTMGWLNGFVGVLIFSGSLPATRLAVMGFEPVFLTGARAVIAGVLGLFLLLFLRQPRPGRQDGMALVLVALGCVVAFPLLTALALQHIGGVDPGPVVLDHLAHGAAGDDHLVRRQAFAQQVVTGNGAVGQVDVCRVVHNAAIRFFRDPHVKTAITCLHMKYRNLPALSRNNCKTAICITQNQQCIRFF